MAIDRRVIRTRTALYDALVALIRTKQYDRISVADILDRANVGRATFYAHFTSKDHLLECSLERLHASLSGALAGNAGRDDVRSDWDPCHTLFEHIQGHHDLWLALTGKAGGEIVRAAFDRVLARFLQTALRKDPYASLPQDLIMRHLVGTVHTVMDWWFAAQAGISAEQAAGLYRQLILRALPAEACEPFIAPSFSDPGCASA